MAIGVAEFFAKGRLWFHQEERKRAATLLAQEALEQTIAGGYASIANRSEARTVGRDAFTVTLAVEDNVPATDMKTIRCQVTWQATAVAQRSVSLTTIAYNH